MSWERRNRDLQEELKQAKGAADDKVPGVSVFLQHSLARF